MTNSLGSDCLHVFACSVPPTWNALPAAEILLLLGLAPRHPSLGCSLPFPRCASPSSLAKSCPVCSLANAMMAEDQPCLSSSTQCLVALWLPQMEVDVSSSFRETLPLRAVEVMWLWRPTKAGDLSGPDHFTNGSLQSRRKPVLLKSGLFYRKES